MLSGPDLPWVTVVTPSLNQGGFIRGAIESVLAQTYPNIEYIVIDGGSADETQTVVSEYQDRLTFISEPDRGQSDAINKGWRMAKGDILAWLCADDLLRPGAVQAAVDAFVNNPDASYVFGGCEMLDQTGAPTGGVLLAETPDTWKLIHGYDYVPQPAAFMSRRAIEAIGFVDETLHFGMDWDLFIRLSSIGRAVPISGVLAQAHVYPETKSLAGGLPRMRELTKIMRLHGDRRFPPAYFIYWADTVKLGCARLLRRSPAGPSRYSAPLIKWVDRLMDRAHCEVLRRLNRGWFDDNWAGPTVSRVFPDGGQMLLLRGRLPGEYPNLTGQKLTVRCNGELLGTRDLEAGIFEWELKLPEHDRADSPELTVTANRYFVPRKLGINNDPRKLSYQLEELTLV